jgi:hypothetical protein
MEYLKLQPGDKVILGRHSYTPNGNANWSPEMDQYVGTETYIAFFSELDTPWNDVIPLYKVVADNKDWHWRICDMIIIPNLRNINHPYLTAKRQNNLLLPMH